MMYGTLIKHHAYLKRLSIVSNTSFRVLLASHMAVSRLLLSIKSFSSEQYALDPPAIATEIIFAIPIHVSTMTNSYLCYAKHETE